MLHKQKVSNYIREVLITGKYVFLFLRKMGIQQADVFNLNQLRKEPRLPTMIQGTTGIWWAQRKDVSFKFVRTVGRGWRAW